MSLVRILALAFESGVHALLELLPGDGVRLLMMGWADSWSDRKSGSDANDHSQFSINRIVLSRTRDYLKRYGNLQFCYQPKPLVFV